MRKTPFFKEILIIICILTISGCKPNIDQQFSAENEQIKAEFKTETQKFVEQNRKKLSEKEMLKSLDSITEEYIINKNKKLAVKFIKSESGVKRLNFLKNYFTKEEIKVLLKNVPEKIKADTNYVALKKYCR